MRLSIPKCISDQLDSLSVVYKPVDNFFCEDIYEAVEKRDERCKQLVRSVAFKHESQNYLTVLPFGYLLDYRVLSDLLAFEPLLISDQTLNHIFKGCQDNSIPPVNGLFDIKLLVDPEVLDME
jgi:prolyl-tRNA editing enzyme YbaK/EbsC (Cys-tRNA(Pro) deacylase)